MEVTTEVTEASEVTEEDLEEASNAEEAMEEEDTIDKIISSVVEEDLILAGDPNGKIMKDSKRRKCLHQDKT